MRCALSAWWPSLLLSASGTGRGSQLWVSGRGGSFSWGVEGAGGGQQHVMQMRRPGGHLSSPCVRGWYSWRGSSGPAPRAAPAPGPHPSLAFVLWCLFPAVRIMNLHELIM